MSETRIDIEAAKQSLLDSINLIAAGKNEQVVRDSFTSYLRQIFPDQPKWVVRHIQGSESAVKISKGEKASTGFVDNLVDLSAIEYEGNLTVKSKYETGYNQVKDYCSGLINKGHDPELVIGILSDTVRWYAYEIDLEQLPEGQCTRDNIILNEIEYIDCSTVNDKTAKDLVRFLYTYLGRIGARPVTAYSIAKDLGFDSHFCQVHINSLKASVTKAFEDNPKYADLIAQLWCSFVSYLREEGVSNQFDFVTYVDEYYIQTLGKLICANYIENRALSSDEKELRSILDGTFFENKGLINFVEYDYFGWLTTEPYFTDLLPVATAIQQDLTAYNFKAIPEEDLFGRLMAQLAHRSQRLLLGQEWTPNWLSHQLVSHVSGNIPDTEHLRLIDMCCGSGSMIVETVKIAKSRIEDIEPQASHERKLQLLIQSITGFDIDPLAVILSKINWVLTAMDWLQPLGAHAVSIPVYHADSLFAITPLSNNIDDQDEPVYSLKIAEYSIDLPEYLISPEYSRLFDALVNTSYRVITDNPEEAETRISDSLLEFYYDSIIADLDLEIPDDKKVQILTFLKELITTIDQLNRDGRNGIWAYILRNSFRPGLVAGQFNGVVSNPPWLALSKIADNPYQAILKYKAEAFDIKPPGSSHLHIELATIFLLHAIQKYLIEDAQIGCIVPDTILNGHHHNPFRKFQFFTCSESIAFDVAEIWKVQEHVFKNNAVILFGTKSNPDVSSEQPIPGKLALDDGTLTPTTFYRNRQGERTAWSEQQLSSDASGFYVPANFRQGADIMPRKLLFYETSPSTDDRFLNVKSIDTTTSDIAFTVKDAKKHQSFSISPRLLPEELFFDIITSNLLIPFDLAPVQKALLPIRKNNSGNWEMIPQAEVYGKSASTRNTFQEICSEIDSSNGNISTLFELIDVRGKLSQQVISDEGYIVITGAGGGKVCSAFIALDDYCSGRLIMDQTVYWAQVQTEDEAIYLSGLLNSSAINLIIEDFQPRGAFGKRHVHKLPFGVTPPFDSEQAAHQDVVEKTRALIQEYDSLKTTNEDVGTLLNPNTGALSRRRQKLLQFIQSLTTYNEYEEACRSLYGV
ncbi:N-6 DNA methylase [Fulvivirgaceae bacterium BMA12]|uniref:site-specific DNA-methyltransferase (adenine-specific) n=1 Tax=Agaribacillus aureus TaxID=3051825 RepID=A0ABT8LAE6_9BACT|nr:N-6 DNA methylase [Fulvivirgaceae bacterium BMA12]